ncbi:MAG: signal peptidase I [Acidobacteriota bacterium]|nr:signal peptidase I [Acidobacteriota bacterium]
MAEERQEDSGAKGLQWLKECVIGLAVSVFIIVFLYQPVKVEGTSMMPELKDQERIFINKYAYRLGAVERGDVVVFRYPGDPSKNYIKRVVGVPGDAVEIAQGQVLLNGARLEEPYVPEQFRDERSMSALTVPQGCYFVLGDHRNLSSDSRDFGVVERGAIFGKAVFAYWPTQLMGKLR